MATSMRERRAWRVNRLWQAGSLAAVIAAVVNVAVYVAARALGTPFVVQPPNRDPSEISAGGVIVFSLVPLMIATGIYGLLRRFTRRPLRVFLLLAVIVFLLLLIPPLVTAQDAATAAALILMHVVATVAILVPLALLERSTFPGTHVPRRHAKMRL